MPRDIEAELRRSLQARAADVTPDPALYSRVQARIRRARTFRFAFAGLATAMVIAGVAVAAPGMMDRVIEFEPGPGGVATQPAPEPSEEPTEASTEAPTPADSISGGEVVLSDSGGLRVGQLGGGTVSLPELPGDAGRISVQPGSTMARTVVAWESSTRFAVSWAAFVWNDTEATRVDGGEVPSEPSTNAASPVFSPDGQSLAWVESTADVSSLRTVDWTDNGPGDDDAGFGLPWSDVILQDWVWTEQTLDGATGYIVVQLTEPVRLLQLPIERQADGGLALTGNPVPISSTDDLTPTAFASGGQGTTVTLELDLGPDGPDAGAVVWRRDGRRIGAAAVPEALFATQDFVDWTLWISASTRTVVFGNLVLGDAWSMSLADGANATTSDPVSLDGRIVFADLIVPAQIGDQTPPSSSQVEVYFGMTGADACVADQPVTREVVSPGVARGAITELLEGPSSRESNEGITSPFTANTGGALNDIKIVDGQAQVDFDDFSADVGNDSCTKSAILDSLNNTLFQFETITSTQYSFDGDVEAFEDWLGAHAETPPAPVVDTQKAIYDAALAHDWERLRRLSTETSCTLSDQKEPCVPYWKDQEERGEDPLGTLVDLLEMPAAKHPDAPMWVWPEEWAAGEGYDGPRIGIDEDGVWRYYVQQGG